MLRVSSPSFSFINCTIAIIRLLRVIGPCGDVGSLARTLSTSGGENKKRSPQGRRGKIFTGAQDSRQVEQRGSRAQAERARKKTRFQADQELGSKTRGRSKRIKKDIHRIRLRFQLCRDKEALRTYRFDSNKGIEI